jgi:hypothetical protein
LRAQRRTHHRRFVHHALQRAPRAHRIQPAAREFASTWTRVVSTTTANGNGNGNGNGNDNGKTSSDDDLKSSSPVIVAGLSLMLVKAGAAELAR